MEIYILRVDVETILSEFDPSGYCACVQIIKHWTFCSFAASLNMFNVNGTSSFNPNKMPAGQFSPNSGAGSFDPNSLSAGKFDPNSLGAGSFNPNSMGAGSFKPNSMGAGTFDPNKAPSANFNPSAFGKK
jgi:hypothetical protein